MLGDTSRVAPLLISGQPPEYLKEALVRKGVDRSGLFLFVYDLFSSSGDKRCRDPISLARGAGDISLLTKRKEKARISEIRVKRARADNIVACKTKKGG